MPGQVARLESLVRNLGPEENIVGVQLLEVFESSKEDTERKKKHWTSVTKLV